MNAQADLLEVPPLTDRGAWRKHAHLDDVIESLCGRYTIVRSKTAQLELFLAWRRNNQDGRWQPPTLLGGFDNADSARSACAAHARLTP